MTVKHREAAAAMIAALAMVSAVCFGKNAAMALFDQNKAVHIKPSEIENATLIIGTHLIYLHSMNEGIYGIAVQSAADSGQDKRYYKSELAGGSWMDITYAESVSDISAGGTAADEHEIERLYLTHHTKSDGITYDLQTNQPVCVYDIVNVYDLENLPELEALKLHYNKMREYHISSKNIDLVRQFLTLRFEIEADLESGEEEKYKEQLEALQQYYKGMSVDDADSKIEKHKQQFQMIEEYERELGALQKYYEELSVNHADSKYLETTLFVMEKVSNARKVQVFTIAGDALEALRDGVTKEADGSDQIDDELLASMEESRYALEESMAEAEANMLSEKDGVVSEKEYELCMLLLSYAEKDDYAACDKQNLQLQYLGNINDGRIVNAAGELELLEELTDSADVRYGVELSKGMRPEYRMLVSQRASHAAWENRMNADVAGATAARGELEFLIQGIIDRRESIGALSGEETQKYILQKIQEAAKFKAVIKQDDYAGKYQDSVTEYVQWLNSLLSGIKPVGSSQGGEQTLYEQKADLQEQKLKALDLLDLDTAKRIDAQIADVDEKIGALETVQSKKLEEMTARKTELESQLSQNPQTKEIQEELDRVEEELAAGQPENQEELRARKAELESQLSQDPQSMEIQAQISTLEAQLAAGQSALSGSSQAANIIESKNEILGLLADGNTGSAAMGQLESHVDLLAAMLSDGSPLALVSLKEVYGQMLAKAELGDVSAYDDLLDKIETAVSESAVSAGRTDALSPGRAEDIIADALGIGSLLDADGSIASESLEEASPQDLQAALLALGSFNDANADDSIAALAKGLAAALDQNPASAVFQTQQQQNESYVPAGTLAQYLGYRYVWNDTRKNAILSRGREFFSFTAYDDQVATEKGETLSMDKPAGFSRQLLIPGSFVQRQFGCYVYDISGTDYSVLVDDKVVERSQDILSELSGGF